MKDQTVIATVTCGGCDRPRMAQLENQLRVRATELATAEKVMAEEFLMLIAAKVNSFQAQKQAEHRHGAAVRLATAEYEIALARLRKG